MSTKAKKADQATDKPSRQEQAQIILEQKLAASQGLVNMLERPFNGKVYVIEMEAKPGQFLNVITQEGKPDRFNFAGDLSTTPRFTHVQARQFIRQYNAEGQPLKLVHLIDAARSEAGRLNAILDYHLAMTAPVN